MNGSSPFLVSAEKEIFIPEQIALITSTSGSVFIIKMDFGTAFALAHELLIKADICEEEGRFFDVSIPKQ